jgi:hypothetical protein
MPRRGAEPRLFAAKEAFSATVDGTPVNIAKGEIVDEHDPVLAGKRRQLFEPFIPKVRRYPGRVEQATRAPGERRA